MTEVSPADLAHLRAAIRLAADTRSRGNRPYAALLSGNDGQVLASAMNTGVADRDCTAHAEINLLREAFPRLGREGLAGTTLYTSAEPCVMCAGAIYWSGIRRVIYGAGLDAIAPAPTTTGAAMPMLGCREIFARIAPGIELHGPLLADEAAAVFAA